MVRLSGSCSRRRCEEQERLPSKEEQWANVAEKEPETVAMIQRVQQTLDKLNSLPPRGCFFDSTEYLDDLASQIGQLLSDHDGQLRQPKEEAGEMRRGRRGGSRCLTSHLKGKSFLSVSV